MIMNKTEFDKLLEFVYKGGGFIPHNNAAFELAHNCGVGEIITVKESGARDVQFHRCYFSLLAYIYGLLPISFQQKIPVQKFYYFLKHLQGKYDVVFEFKDGTKLVEYESIAFGRMSQKTFENYVTEQLTFIYSDIIGAFYTESKYELIIASIETEYEKFLANLR